MENEKQQQAAPSPVCAACGAKTRKAKFCPECGEPVPPPRTACGSCGHAPERAPKFCPECGAEMPVAP